MARRRKVENDRARRAELHESASVDVEATADALAADAAPAGRPPSAALAVISVASIEAVVAPVIGVPASEVPVLVPSVPGTNTCTELRRPAMLYTVAWFQRRRSLHAWT